MNSSSNRSSGRLAAGACVLGLACGMFAPGAAAQEQPRQAVPVEASRAGVSRAMDAEATRQSLMDLLRKHPPAVGRVLKLDPSLMRNESYLASYPSLRQFLTEYPEVTQNAGYYLEPVRGAGDDHWTPPTPQQRIVESTLAGLAVISGFAIFLGTAIWLIRTVLEHRRWNRLSRIQAEVHTKLMDRFSASDELLTYVQTPSGRRFLESGPSPLQEMAPAIAAPFSRILWSVQVGAILLVGGLGMLFLSGRAIPEVREFFYIAGCLAAALGTGFVVSAAAAYVLSRRLGLIEPPAQHHA